VKAFLFSLLIAVFITCALLALPVWAASPVGKTHRMQDYTQDCGNGRRGTKCIELYTINLSWDTPTQREDSSPLPRNEIFYYVLQYERGSGVTVQLAVSPGTEFQLYGMPAGAYTFRIATVDSDRQQGNFSDDISLTVP